MTRQSKWALLVASFVVLVIASIVAVLSVLISGIEVVR